MVRFLMIAVGLAAILTAAYRLEARAQPAFSWPSAPSASPSTEPSAPAAKDKGDRPSRDAKGASEVPASKRPATPPGPFALPTDLPAKPRFVVVELHEEVNLGMAAFVERVAAELEKDDILVIDIKTFGGRVDAAVTIRDALLHTHDAGARAVVWINPRAISAGALISYAADVIAVAPGSTIGAATPVQVGSDQEMKPTSEKVVSYMRQEMRATAEARGRNGDIAEAMVDADREVDGLIDAGKLLTLDGKRAIEWGVASFEANDFDQVVAGLGYEGGAGAYEVKRVTWSWAEEVAGWLSSSIIAGLLMTIGMLGIMIGLYTGGNPIALTVGGICLVLFFFGHHVVNLAGIEDMVLFVIGMALIGFEVFSPGHIYPGIIGVICVIASLFMGLIDFSRLDFSIQWHAGYVADALATVFGSILMTAIASYAAFKAIPHSRYGRRLLLATSIDATATDDLLVSEQEASLVGEVGTVVNDLRPSGKVKIGGRRHDAKSDHGFIAAGSKVKVLRRDGFDLVVAKIGQEPEPPDDEDAEGEGT